MDTYIVIIFEQVILTTCLSVLKLVNELQTVQKAASDLGLHCLLRSVCPNTVCYNSIVPLQLTGALPIGTRGIEAWGRNSARLSITRNVLTTS